LVKLSNDTHNTNTYCGVQFGSTSFEKSANKLRKAVQMKPPRKNIFCGGFILLK
jgi:hypothetical protein